MGDPAQPVTAPPPSGGQTGQETNQGHIGDTYEVPTYEAHSSFAALKDRIRHHYELASDYYYSLW